MNLNSTFHLHATQDIKSLDMIVLETVVLT